MPIDPSLITDTMARWQVPQIQVPDPLATYSKLQALRQGIQQQQLTSLQLQKAQADEAQRQRDLNDQQILQKAAADPATMKAVTSWDGVSPFPLAGSGLSFKAMQDMQTKVLADQKAALQWNDERAASNLKKTARVGDVLTGLMYDENGNPRPDAEIAAQAPGAFSKLQTEGVLPAGVAIQPVSGFGDLQKYALANNYAEGIAKAAAAAKKSAAETAKNQSEGDLAATKAREAQQQQDATALEAAYTQGGAGAFLAALSKLPADRATPFAGAKSVEDIRNVGMSPEQRTQAAQAKANAEQTATHQATEERQGAQRIGIEAANLALRRQELAQKSNSDYANLGPADRAIAEKIASGEMSVQQLSRMPNKQGITGAALELNPNWSAATFDTRQAFTDPNKKMSQNLGTIARIVGHIGQFEQNSKNLGFAPLYSSGVTLTGDQARLREDSHAIASELEKLVSGGVATQGQAKAWQAGLSSPLQGTRQQAIDEISKLIGSQFEGMNQTYKAGLGVDLPVQRYVSQAGQQWMKNKGIEMPGLPGAGAAPTSAPPASLLQRGVNTHFRNGQVWTLDANGQPQQVNTPQVK